jgi:hypothetical protein
MRDAPQSSPISLRGIRYPTLETQRARTRILLLPPIQPYGVFRDATDVFSKRNLPSPHKHPSMDDSLRRLWRPTNRGYHPIPNRIHIGLILGIVQEVNALVFRTNAAGRIPAR